VSGGLSGQRAWLLQRLSAALMVVYLIYVVQHLLFRPPTDFAAWQTWWRGGFMALSSTFFLLALILHAWVGGRDIILDYVRPLGARITMLCLLGAFLIFCTLWAIRILLVTT